MFQIPRTPEQKYATPFAEFFRQTFEWPGNQNKCEIGVYYSWTYPLNCCPFGIKLFLERFFRFCRKGCSFPETGFICWSADFSEFEYHPVTPYDVQTPLFEIHLLNRDPQDADTRKLLRFFCDDISEFENIVQRLNQ